MNRAAVLPLVVLVTLLAGCTPTPPAPTSAPPTEAPSPTPTPTPTVAPITAPEPLLDLTCDTLLGDGVVRLFTGGVSAHDPERTIAEAGTSVAYKYAVEQLGGLACEWSNGVAQSDKLGADPDYVGIALSIAPVAEAQWAEFRDYYGVEKNRQVYCFTDTGFFCAADVFVDGWWIESQSVGMNAVKAKTLLAAYRGVIDDVIDRVTTAAPTGAVWAAPEGTQPIPDCEGILSADDAAAATGGAVVIERPQGGVSLEGVVRIELASLWCTYSSASSGDSIDALFWLPGGEWAWLEESTFDLPGGAPDEITVAGLEDGDSAWLRCYDGTCEVDLIVDHNWINYTGRDGGQPVIEKIAAAIVANLKG